MSNAVGERFRDLQTTPAGAVLLSADIAAGALAGPLAGVVVLTSKAATENAQTVLIAVAGVGTGLVAFVLTGLALLLPALTNAFRRMLGTVDDGFESLMAPYRWVVGVSSVSAVAGLMGALLWPAVESVGALRFIVGAIPMFLVVWALGGSVQLVGITTKAVSLAGRTDTVDDAVSAHVHAARSRT